MYNVELCHRIKTVISVTIKIDAFKWLTSTEAAPILEDIDQKLAAKANVLQIVKQLRKVVSAEQSALILELAQLRRRASKKFDRSSQMFFTRRTLEMATDQRIAAWKAKRFAGISNIVDICSGIGGDLIGLAMHVGERIVGVDQEELMVCYANANLAAHGVESSVTQQSFEDFDWSPFEAVHIDPERRSHGRTVRGDHFSPSLSSILSAAGSDQSLAIKVAPATDCADEAPADAELNWIGHSRECKQQVVWLGKLAKNPGCRSVTLLHDQGETVFIANRNEPVDSSVAKSIGQYLFEPHNAVLAASLTDEIAHEYELQRIAAHSVYLTGDRAIDNPLLASFKVLESMPSSLEKVASVFKSMNVGRVEVKKRGVPERIADNYKRLKLTGTEQATLLLTRIGNQRIAIIAERVVHG